MGGLLLVVLLGLTRYSDVSRQLRQRLKRGCTGSAATEAPAAAEERRRWYLCSIASGQHELVLAVCYCPMANTTQSIPRCKAKVVFANDDQQTQISQVETLIQEGIDV